MSTQIETIPIYKVERLINKNKTKTIFVFYGSNISKLDINSEFNNALNNNVSFSDPLTNSIIFNEDEIKNIKDKNIEVIFSQQQIHFDDTIGIIKLKIINEFKNLFSPEEIYLYCKKDEILNSINIYETLTQKNRLKINKTRLLQFLDNILNDKGEKYNFNIPDKEYYDYNDILALNLNDKTFLMNKVLGQKFFIVTSEYPYVCDPFEVTSYDEFIERASRKSLTTLNSHLLLNTGTIKNNTIYLCFAEDVLKSEINISDKKMEEYTIKVYYPKLYNKNISSLDELKSERIELIEENNKILNKSTIENFESVDIFYDVYKYRKTELKYKNKGIKFIKLVLHPDYDVKIPLDIIFKLIHATEINPLIKYNASVRQEKIYRVYTDKIAKDGRKIPYLQKGEIFKLMKKIGKNKSVSVHINYKADGLIYLFDCEFEENGNIIITSNFEKIVDINEINKILSKAVNPIIEEVKNYLEQNGYTMNLFENLNNQNVEIKQITYESEVSFEKIAKMKLSDLKGCISSVFIIENIGNLNKEGIKLRFKRVSNFNKRTSQEAFIIEKQKEGYRGEEIIDLLMSNYKDISRQEAIEIISKLITELEVERGVKKREIEIKINPGFPITIKEKPYTNELILSVENINDIYYLDTIPIYLDTLLRLTQDKNSTNYPTKKIKSICSGDEKSEILLEDNISLSEASLGEQKEIPYIDNDEIEFQKIEEFEDSEEGEEKAKNAISMFFGDDDDEEEEEESDNNFRGGNNESSDKSLSSFDNSEIEVVQKNKLSDDSFKSNLDSEIESESKSLSDVDNSLSSIDNVENVDKSEEQVIQKNENKSEESNKITNNDSPEESSEEIIIVKKPIIENDKERNIDGMPLSNQNSYFQKRIEDRDPVLILKSDQGKYTRYSRICTSSSRRQPIILNKQELDKINQEHKGFLKDEDIVQYSSTPDKNFYYICPKYWDLRKETIVTDEDIEKYNLQDKIIPKGATSVPKGKYIYKFLDEKQYPNFVKGDKHPDGFCLPCCVSNFNTPGVIKTREKCTGKINASKKFINKKESIIPEKDEEADKEEREQKIQEEIIEPSKMKDYVKGPEKFPLDRDRWGYLPTSVQKLLHEINANCQISKTNTNIKPNHACLLRHGVETNINQSFIACISDALFYTKTDEKGKPLFVSVEKMKDIIIKTLNIDNFIKYQNGNLVNDFNEPLRVMDENKIEKYKSSKLYQKLISNNSPENNLYFKNVCSSFENFIAFLKDKYVKIDYTYLWDIVCDKNEYLFNKGINLVILELPNDDITNNINLICPTNHYSGKSYESRKPTLILLKQEDYYEPIYSYKYDNKKNKLFITKIFSEYDTQLSQSMRDVFNKVIKPFYDDIDNNYSVTCKPQNSISKSIYKADHPIPLNKIIQILLKKKYNIIKQVVNYQSKVIGIISEKSSNEKVFKGFLPCYPSSIDDNYDYDFMIDKNLWSNYNDTIDFLLKVSKDTNQEIKSKPIYKIVEDEVVVGVLTETNQFIQLSEPYPLSFVRDNIPIIRDSNYIINKDDKHMEQSDVIITTTNKFDVERVNFIRKIKLETNFYNVFRNTIRILLNNYINSDIREKIEKEMMNPYSIYSSKLSNIDKLLKELVNRKDTIKFIDNSKKNNNIQSDFFDSYSTDIVNTCVINNTPDKCNNKAPLCKFNDDKDSCQILLPKENLINSTSDNEIYYYARMADELIRYNRIKSFILKPQIYLSFGTINYNLRDDEIILLESLITQEYFEDLKEAPFNKFVKYNSYDEAEPLKSIIYETSVEIDANMNMKNNNVKDCGEPIVSKIYSIRWKNCFPKDFTELEYEKTPYCSFYFIIDIIKNKDNKIFKINEIRNILFEEYQKYLQNYQQQILDILIKEGKKSLSNQVKSNLIDFESMIFSDNYFLTTFDYWLLVNKFKIPTFFISKSSNKNLIETNNKSLDMLGYGNKDNSFVFIVVPGLRAENIPNYKYIQNNSKKIFIKLDELKNCENKKQLLDCFNQDNKIIIDEFLKSYENPINKKKSKNVIQRENIKNKIILEEDSSDIQEKYSNNDIKNTFFEPNPQKIIENNNNIKLKGKKKTRKVKPDLINTRKTKKNIVMESE